MAWVLVAVVVLVAVTVVVRFVRLRQRSNNGRQSFQDEPVVLRVSAFVMNGPPPSRWGHKKMGAGYKLTIRTSAVDVSNPLVGHELFDPRETTAERLIHHAATGSRDWIVLRGLASGKFTELTLQVTQPEETMLALESVGVRPLRS
jgi:hypothetical protein